MNSIKTQPGYTLLELIIVITLLSVLATMAASSWSAAIADSRQRTQINEYRTFFNFARWQAASMNTIVTVCPLNAAQNCVDDWEGPVHVFVDNDRDGRPDDDVLRVMRAPGNSFGVRSRTAGTGYFRFNETGMLHGRTGGLISCSDSASITLIYIAINKGGRFRVEYDRDKDGRITASSGDAISC